MKDKIKKLTEIGKEILKQDNRCTANPVFVVYEKKKVTSDKEYNNGEYIWVNDGTEYETDQEVVDAIKEYHEKEINIEDYDEQIDIDGDYYDKWYYQEVEVYVQTFFTAKSAQEYIDQNGHRLNEPFFYAESLFRNEEMKTVRNFLIDLAMEDEKDEKSI